MSRHEANAGPNKYQVALTPSFWASLEDLGAGPRKHVREAVEKLGDGLTAVHLHKLEGVDFVSFGVNQGGLRVICHRDGAALVLLHVGKHDPAYEWARRHRFVQAGSYVRLVRGGTVSERGDEEPPRASLPASLPAPPSGPLTRVTDETFARFDIEPFTAALLRSLPHDDAVIQLLQHFAPRWCDALMGLATEPDELEALAAAYNRAKAASPAAGPSLAEALSKQANSAEAWLVPPDDAAVARALEGGLAAWRVFLHPSQARLVRTDAKGAMKIGGGPGTGKTVVALHRARWLAEALAPDPRPVLVTTFSTPLARQLEPRLDELCADAPHLRQRIVVMGTTRLAQDLLRQAARPNRLLTDLDEAWATALTHDGANRGRSFYECERVEVVARRGVRSEAEYLQAKRTGLRVKLTRPERAEVWRVLAAFEAALVAQGGGDDLALALAAAQAVDSGAASRPYAAIVCDEAQDLGAGELRLLAALAREPSGTALGPNSLTLAGDAYQRLYRAPVPLMDCGIDVRGRSRILRINYRTTEAIRAAAVQLLQRGPVEPDESDAGTLEGYRSLRRGSPPEERAFDSAEAEADWIASLSAPAKPGEPASSPLLVLARTNAELDELRRLLVARGRTPRVLGTNDLPDEHDPLVLCTLHRAKGLESPRVVITGVGKKGRFPGGDARDRALWEASQEAALYVGYTRARDWCAVTHRA